MEDTHLVTERFNAHISPEGLLRPDKRYLLAVSGGVDSMVLAHLFRNAGLDFTIAHCNFQLRGTASQLDEQLVTDWAALQGIPCRVRRFDTVAETEARKMGIQEAARHLRYQWFGELVEQEGYYRVVTAHHANDNAETLLLNLLKGTGIAGLHGILPDNGTVVRPLLFAEKKWLQAYAAAAQIPFREDESNLKDDYMRNALRNQIIPVIENYFPHAIRQINQSMVRFSEAEAIYNKSMDVARRTLMERRGTDLYLPVRKLRKQEPLATIVYELTKAYGFGPLQVQAILSLMDAETGHYLVSSTHRIVKHRDFLVITDLPMAACELVVVEHVPFELTIQGRRWSLNMQAAPERLPQDAQEAVLDATQLKWPLILRKWKQGDYFYPLGMQLKKKKLSRFLIDRKVALHDKEQVWVLECGGRIAWVAGLRMDERFKVKPGTREVLVARVDDATGL